MTVQLDADVQEKLTRYLSESGEPCNRAINAVLREFLEDREDYETAAKALEEHEREGLTYSAEEVRNNLGLED